MALFLMAAPGFAKKSGDRPPAIKREPKGQIRRPLTPKAEFRQTHPCPSTNQITGACPGYVIEYIKPLKRGGSDVPSNMQWKNRSTGKAAD